MPPRLPEQAVTPDTRPRILTINAGSSSVKMGLFAVDADETLLASASVDRIADHAAALHAALGRIRAAADAAPLGAIAHRVVHGGVRYREPVRITGDVRRDLQALTAIDPDHTPQALAAIETIGAVYPAVPQIACFDTAFHRTLPRVAQLYALPRRFRDAGIRRYGFHGLSCESIVRTLGRLDPKAADGRIIVAHLGSGASLTAIRHGRSVETTMGFSPTGGIVMGTRSGDLDPGVMLQALQHEQLGGGDLSRLVNRDAGLLGVSETSQDMRDLLEREVADARAADAVALFCHAARKSLGALMAVLGGLDTLIFTAGIGEHAAPVRERICAGLEAFGIALDEGRNAAHAPEISTAGATVTVRIVETDEDRMLARHAHDVLATGEPHV
jgi:acetate kinase